MKKEERDLYLDKWGPSCFICEATVEREDMGLVRSIVELKRVHEDVRGDTIQYYMVCPKCREGRVLV